MKKSLKRLGAFLLASVMVFSMGLSASAVANSAEIIIKADGVEVTQTDITNYKYVQVIKPDVTTPTGWAFCTPEIAAHYIKAFSPEGTDPAAQAQAVLDEMINNPGVSASMTEMALSGVLLDPATVFTGIEKNPLVVDKAGVYAIKGSDDANFIYNPMSAYISFTDYDKETGIPENLKGTEVNAKRTPIDLEKEGNGGNTVVEIGRDVSYKITTNVPFIPDGREYKVTDTISGAVYKETSLGSGKLAVTVQVGEGEVANELVDITTNENGLETFTLDLTERAKDINNRNEKLTITYMATVTDVKVGNTVVAGDGENDSEFGSDEDILRTGEITLTKTGEKEVSLDGAEFVVYKLVDGKEVYARFNEKDGNKLVGWVNSLDQATRLITGEVEKGKIKVQGLDANVTYYFKETKAPDGYSVNDKDAVTSWDLPGDLKETVKGTASMTDTKLGTLPETGGMGTYMFIIGGVVLMAAAAGMFFISRRRRAE